jgi:hypothetical protein
VLELATVLKSTGDETLIALFQDSNDVYLEIPHLDLIYTHAADMITVVGTARIVATDGTPGKYKGAMTLKYKRGNVTTLMNGVVQLPFPANFPFSFSTLKASLKVQYGLVIEAQDVLIPNTTTLMTDDTQITAAMAVAGVFELKVADKSPRFIPKSAGGGSFYIKVVDPSGGQLDYLAGTTTLGSVTTMDA